VAVESNDLYNGTNVEYQMKQKWVANKVKSKVNLFRDSRSNYRIPLSCAIIILLVQQAMQENLI